MNKEIELATIGEKKIVPVTLDSTALPSELAAFQAIDFSGKVKHTSLLRECMRFYGALGGIVSILVFSLIVFFVSTFRGCSEVPEPSDPTVWEKIFVGVLNLAFSLPILITLILFSVAFPFFLFRRKTFQLGHMIASTIRSMEDPRLAPDIDDKPI